MRLSRSFRAARPALFSLVALTLLAAPAAAKPRGPVPQTFKGDQGAIAFSRTVGGVRTNIFRMDVDGSDVTNLTNNDTTSDGLPAWSESGAQIAFVSTRDDPNGDIYRMTADGSGVTRLTDDPSQDSNPSWYPNNRRVVFESERTGNFDLWYQDVDANGAPVGDPVQLTSDPRPDVDPVVSPDGKLIAFASDRVTRQNPEGDAEIFVMKAGVPEGPKNKPRQLTKNNREDLSPDWSPNGKKIAFATDRDDPGGGSFAIYTMTSKGRQQQRLTPEGQDARGPSWSPDGARLAYFSISTKGDVFRINADGSQSVNLTEGFAGDSVTPAWQPR